MFNRTLSCWIIVLLFVISGDSWGGKVVRFAGLAGLGSPQSVPLSPDDVRVIVNPRVESDFVLDLIAGAKSKVWLGTYHISPDDSVGWPLLKALEDAASRPSMDVKVFVSSFAGWNGDLFNYTGAFLSHVASHTSLEFFMIGSSMKGWYGSDTSHAKILIIDDRIIVVTGRGYGEMYQQWFDLAYVFKGPAVAASAEAYRQMWANFQKINPQELPSYDPDMQPYWDAFSVPRKQSALGREKDELAELQAWEKQPASEWPSEAPECSSEFVSRGARGECKETIQVSVLQNGILNQLNSLRKSPSRYNYAQRLRLLEKGRLNDAISEDVVDQIQKAEREVKIISYALLFSKPVKEAIKDALRRGVNVDIITNGKGAQSSIMPWFSLWAPIGYYQSLPDADELLTFAHSPKSRGDLKVHLFREKNPGTDLHFVHAKLVIVDDVVYFGSHNLTYISSIVQDELQWKFVGHSFATTMRKNFDQLKDFCELFEQASAKSENRAYLNWFKKKASQPFSWLF